MLLVFSPFVRLYLASVQFTFIPDLRLHDTVQGVWGECAGAGGDNAGFMDYCGLPAVRGEAEVSAARDFQGTDFAQIDSRARAENRRREACLIRMRGCRS
jgi:hypothetical protein